MATDAHSSRHVVWWLGGALLVALAAIALVLWMPGDDRPPAVESSPPPGPATWSADPERQVRLSSGPDGPKLRRSGDDLSLTPESEALSDVSWRTHADDSTIRFAASARWHDQPARIDWQFATGNPQARLTLRVRDVPVDKLKSKRFSFDVALPGGPVDVLDEQFQIATVDEGTTEPLRIPPVRPTWLRWRPGTQSVTWHRWSGDGVRAASEESNVVLTFDLWRPDLHPSIRQCQRDEEDSPDRQSGRTLDLRATLTMSLGDAPRLFPTAFPSSHRGLLVPIFDLPSAHPDSQLQSAGARDAEDWTRRATTLAYGHSDTSDPRYGTGGLLGNELGGTVVAPASYAGTEALQRFRDSVEGSDVGLATRGQPDIDSPNSAPETSVRLQKSTACAEVVSSGDAPALSVLAGPMQKRESPPTDALRGGERGGMPNFPIPTHPVPVRPLVDRLDGSRQTLLDRVLDRSTLESLVDSRGLALVATPLVATRNPLVPAARESLLEPERFGRWTLAQPFSSALTELSLVRENTPVGVVGLEQAVRHLRTARATRLQWQSDGTLTVRPPSGPNATRELTLMALGEQFRRTDVRIDDKPPRHRMRSGNNRPETRFSFGLADGERHTVEFEGIDGFPSGLEPVGWTVEE